MKAAKSSDATQNWNITPSGKFCQRITITMRLSGTRKKFMVVDLIEGA